MIIVKNRELLIPNNERYIGTTYDSETENRIFQVPRYSQRGVDLAALTFRLDIQYANESYDTIVLDKEIGEAFVILIWRITSSTLQVPGTMYIGLRAVDNEATVKWSSFSAAMYVERHLNTPGNYGGGLSEIEQMEQDHQYMKGVVNELKEHIDYTFESEAWAVGKRDGEDVPETDPTYHNNSKYYSEQAGASATAAANSATAAAGSATAAHDDSEAVAASRAQIAQNASNIAIQTARIDQFTHLAEGSTTGDAELMDARVGADGVTYSTAGDAVRANDSLLKSQLEDIAEFTVEETSVEETADILSEITWTEGYYMAKNGTPFPQATLKYSNKISVSEGDTISIVPTNSAFRYICAYANDVAIESSGAETVNTYTVPSGIDAVVLTAYISASYAPTAINHTYTESTYVNILDDDIEEINTKLDSINDAITTVQFEGDIETTVTPIFTTGAVAKNGTAFPSYTAFQYTQKISVAEGDVVEALSSGVPVAMRFVCAYARNTVNESAGSDADPLAYTVPAGIDGVIITTRIASAVDTIRATSHGTVTASYAKPIPMGYMMDQAILTDGDSMMLPFHNVKISNCYVFNANIGSFNSVTFRKQPDTYITVNGTNLIIHNDQTEITVPHGLTIGHNIGLFVENATSYTATLIRISSDGEYFDYTTPVRFLMDTGTPTILSTGSTLTECTFSWVSKNVNCPIWVFGDSYLSWYPQRWTYYLAEDGYTNVCLLNGYAGQASNTAYQALVNLLAVTTPKIVVWCMGMNDPDSDGAVSTAWNTVYEKVEQLCLKLGVELVLYTVPTTPTMNNRFKDAIIRASGYRYIEADKAVRINDNGDWVTGALESDQVHPTAIGAKILYSRILADLPELMCNR